MAHLLSQVGHLQWVVLAAIFWGAWAWCDRGSDAARFTALHPAIGLASSLAQWVGDGVFGNAEFDLTIALGIGAAFARVEASPVAAAISTNPARVGMVTLLALRLVASGRQESAWVMFNPEFRAHYKAAADSMAAVAASVSKIPGAVYCKQRNLVCWVAGKTFVADDFKTEQLLATGRATQADIAAMLDARGITVIEGGPAMLVATAPQPRL